VYEQLGLDEKTRELYRCCWWSIYFADVFSVRDIGEQSVIHEDECKVYLMSGMNAPLDKAKRQLTMQVMLSPEKYVLPIQGLDLRNYPILLMKILRRILGAWNCRPVPFRPEDMYELKIIHTSLDHWYESLPPSVLPSNQSDKPIKFDLCSSAISYSIILYHAFKVNLNRLLLCHNVLDNPDLARSSNSFNVIFKSSSEGALAIASLMEKVNSVDYFPSFVQFSFFGTCLTLLMTSRLDLQPAELALVQNSYRIYYQALSEFHLYTETGQNQQLFLEYIKQMQSPTALAETIKTLVVETCKLLRTRDCATNLKPSSKLFKDESEELSATPSTDSESGCPKNL
jgi:hypothetical protein